MISSLKSLWEEEPALTVVKVSIFATFKGNKKNNERDGYSMDPLLPKKEGVCDECGHNLVIREDDTEKVISSRMKEYDAKTKPLLNEFEKMGALINFEAKKGVKDYPELKTIVENKLSQI